MQTTKQLTTTLVLVTALAYVSNVHTMNKPLSTADRKLFAAIEAADAERINTALTKGADINGVSKQGYTPLTHAIINKNNPIIELLIANKADINTSKEYFTPLIMAAMMGSVPMIELLLSLNADVNMPDQHSETPLMYAANNSRTSTVKMLLAHNAHINAKNKNNHTALMLVIQRGDRSMTQLLIDNKADINTISNDHTPTPLMIAITSGHSLIAQILINNKANIDATDRYGLTPLMVCVNKNEGSLVHLLLNKKAKIDTVSPSGCTALAFAALYDRASLIGPLLKHGANIEAPTNWGRTPLMSALNPNCLISAEALLDRKANVNAADTKDGYTPLMLTILTYPDNSETVQLLLQRKANSNAVDKNKKTALRHAVEKNNTPEILATLIAAGADCDSIATDGLTPLQAAPPEIQQVMLTLVQEKAEQAKLASALHKAIRQGDTEAIHDLLKKSTHVEYKENSLNYTLLMNAAASGHIQIAELLLDKKAAINATTIHSLTPLTYAARNKNIPMIEMLLDRKADINATDTNKTTILLMAVQRYNSQLVKLLLDHKADAHITNKNGDTPLEWAIVCNKPEIAEMLILAGARYSARVHINRDFLKESTPKTQQAVLAAQQKRALIEQEQKQILQQNKALDVVESVIDQANNSVNIAVINEYEEVPFTMAKATQKKHEREEQEQHNIKQQKKAVDKALLKAAIQGEEQSAYEALDSGADINTVDLIGRTSLMWAIFYEHTKVIRILLDKGAHIDTRDNYGHTAPSLAREITNNEHRTEILRMIATKKAEKNTTKKDDNRTITQKRSLEKTISAIKKQNDAHESDYLIQALSDYNASLATH